MLWRYGTVKAGVRLDSERRYVLGEPGRVPAASEAVKRFLHFYGPATPGDFAEWAVVAKPHAKRLWEAIEAGLSEVPWGSARASCCAKMRASSTPRSRRRGPASSRRGG